jgi:hypothetical protein
LEPWMFTLVALWLMARQDLKNWWHLGFILLQDFAPSNKVSLSPEEKLQQCHNDMSVLLDEVKEVSKGKPMMWVNLGGIWKKRKTTSNPCCRHGWPSLYSFEGKTTANKMHCANRAF